MLQQIPLMGRGRYLESMDGWVNRIKYYCTIIFWEFPHSRCCGKMYECSALVCLVPEPCGTCEEWGVQAAAIDNTGETRHGAVCSSLQTSVTMWSGLQGNGDGEDASCVLTSWGLLGKMSSILWRCWLVLTLRVMISEMWCNKNQVLCSHNLKLTLVSLHHTSDVIQTYHNKLPRYKQSVFRNT